MKLLFNHFCEGITEAFVHATMDEKGLTQSNVFMLVSAGMHMFMSILMVSINGSIGLVWADCCNMIIRIVYSIRQE